MGYGFRNATLFCLLGGSLACAWGQGAIYTCVDSKGRRLTSDRPIADCVDREQKELNPSATVRRTVGPSLTATEQAAKEERERRIAEDRLKQAEEKRAERALVARYPNQAVHDLERAKALDTVQASIRAGQLRLKDLEDQRQKLDLETDFYKRDPSRYPVKLKRQLEENEQLHASQQRLLTNQEEEKFRVNRRYDEELARLRGLWGTPAPASTVDAAKK